jgi:hypothetical protein
VTISGTSRIKPLTARRPRSGSALRGAGRVALWIAVAIVLVRGIGAIASDPDGAPTGRGAQIAEVRFPDDEARAFAVRFVNAYLDPAGAGSVARFLADGLSDRAAVVPPRGPGASVAWATVARAASLGGARALVTVAALRRDGTSRYVTVPVARDQRGGLVVSGLPSFSPPPPRANVDGEDVEPLTGRGAAAISELVERFLREYVAGADRAALSYLLVPGARVAPLSAGLRVVAVDGLDQATSTTGRRRSVIASVRVRESSTGAIYPVAYRLDVARRDRWYVAAVAGGPGA